MNILLSIIVILVTILIYILMKRVYEQYRFPLLVPTATTTLILVVLLLFCHIDYKQYMVGGKWIGELLGPAVVALAYPLFRNKHILKKYGFSLSLGIVGGALVGIFSGIYLSVLLHIDSTFIKALAPKSVTSPVAMDVAMITKSSPSLAAVYVMIAGISGAVFGNILLKYCHVNHFVGIGAAFGTGAHGIGTAKALELGEEEGAISSVAMTLSAVVTVLLCPAAISFVLNA